MPPIPLPEPLRDPPLERVILMLCEPCLDGMGGECHSPGCALWMSAAPDIPIRGHVESPGTVEG